MTLLAARQSALLSLLFLVVYGGCNWVSAQRTDVGIWYFAWERHLPFWPAMIVPYLSIDMFFLAAPFLCRDREELRVFTRRTVAAILTAGICFVLMPLRLAVARPAVDGWLGALFSGFLALDQPFNLFPSLHIALAVILADTYGRHSKGTVRLATRCWFVLIGASTLFTYQHHIVDVAGGLALATLVFYLVRERSTLYSGSRNIRVAGYYLLGAGMASGMAALLWPWGALLLWPAFSLALVSGAYYGIGPWIFAKSNGKIPISTRVVLWPYLLGQHASLAFYRRRCRAYDRVTPEIWIGRRLNEREAAEAVAEGVSAVVDLTADFDEAPGFTSIAYKCLPTLDLTAPTLAALDRAVHFITDHVRRGVVFVHCKIGYSRSVAVVGAYLLASGRARTSDDAVRMIRAARPQIVVRPEALAALREFECKPAFAPLMSSLVSCLLGAAARVFCGSPRFAETLSGRPRIYFANHTSHLDFVAIWGSLPPEIRARTRPVAGRDYWDRGPIRRFIARRVLRAVLVERPGAGCDRETTVASARRGVQRCARALAAGASLVIFPEGTRGQGAAVGPFKSGLYYLCLMRPDVELVPVLLEGMNRILPKGEVIPLPLGANVTFGRPIRLLPGEDKNVFLARAHAALMMVNRPWTSVSTVMSRAS